MLKSIPLQTCESNHLSQKVSRVIILFDALISGISVLDEYKCQDLIDSSQVLNGIKSLLDFLVLIRGPSSTSTNDLSTIFDKLCTLIFDLRFGKFYTDSLLNSLILFGCALDYSAGKSYAAKQKLPAGFHKLFELIIASHARNICLIGKHLSKTITLCIKSLLGSTAQLVLRQPALFLGDNLLLLEIADYLQSALLLVLSKRNECPNYLFSNVVASACKALAFISHEKPGHVCMNLSQTSYIHTHEPPN